MLLARPHDRLIDVDHGDELGVLLEELMEERPVTSAQDQHLLPLVVLGKYQDYIRLHLANILRQSLKQMSLSIKKVQ